MSVVRFNLETPTLPILQVQPMIGATDLVTTVYNTYMVRTKTGVGAGVVGSVTNVSYQPSDISVSPPSLPITTTAYTSPYYNVFSHQAFVDMVNASLQTNFIALYGTGPDIPNTVPPYLYWDIGSNTAILNVSKDLVSATDTISIFFNASLYTLFSSFPATFSYYNFPVSPIATQKTPLYQITINTGLDANISQNTISMPTVPPSQIVIYTYQILQEYSTGPLWSPIDSIVFTTSLIPVIPELVASPIVYNSNGFASIGNNANISTVLTDFIVPMTTGNEYKPSINYTPAGEYRLASLFGKNPIHSIQVNVFYKDRFGNLIPMTLATGCSGSIKIMFRRKDFANLILDD